MCNNLVTGKGRVNKSCQRTTESLTGNFFFSFGNENTNSILCAWKHLEYSENNIITKSISKANLRYYGEIIQFFLSSDAVLITDKILTQLNYLSPSPMTCIIY